ncbi:hypothetical protein A2U01_0044440, partial [Trifolium medium]|nr:hypothetical protein [Trifolium medium]
MIADGSMDLGRGSDTINLTK